MLKRALIPVFILTGFQASAQFTLSDSAIDFGTVTKGSPKTVELIITNNSDQGTLFRILPEDKSFTANLPEIGINAHNTDTIRITFDPFQNVDYNSEIIVQSSGLAGSRSVDVRGKGVYVDSYYDATQNLYDEDLKSALKSLLAKNYKSLGYNTARDYMYGNIDNHDGVVTCVYTGRTAVFNDRNGANSNSFNCEHTWPQSLFNSNEPEKSDLNHIFPTDNTANSYRSNYPFGVVNSPTWTNGGSKYGSSLFEPRDAHKGNVARALFYFSIRYQNYSSFLTNQETILRSWASSFPPTSSDSLRNEQVFYYQKNRNPFVDHPEFLERIQSISSTSKLPPKYIAAISASNIDLGKFPATNLQPYVLVVYNGGSDSLRYSLSNSRQEIVPEVNQISIAPGESYELKIWLHAGTEIGKITDTIFLSTSKEALNFKIDVTAEILSLSVRPNELIKANLSIIGNRLSILNANHGTIRILDISGRTIRLNDITSSFTEMPLNDFVPGVYFAVLEDRNGVQQSKKFVISEH
ncbi:MAG: T9SS type A sorting domain-containing protein [Bacteroidetes bacterium]|nr:T9SS type A sorting domain-containing protein [Bacteroidota bacterium]